MLAEAFDWCVLGVVGQHSDASKGRFVVFEDYVDKEDVGSILSGRGRLALAEQTNNKKSMDTLVLWPRQGVNFQRSEENRIFHCYMIS